MSHPACSYLHAPRPFLSLIGAPTPWRCPDSVHVVLRRRLNHSARLFIPDPPPCKRKRRWAEIDPVFYFHPGAGGYEADVGRINLLYTWRDG